MLAHFSKKGREEKAACDDNGSGDCKSCVQRARQLEQRDKLLERMRAALKSAKAALEHAQAENRRLSGRVGELEAAARSAAPRATKPDAGLQESDEEDDGASGASPPPPPTAESRARARPAGSRDERARDPASAGAARRRPLPTGPSRARAPS